MSALLTATLLLPLMLALTLGSQRPAPLALALAPAAALPALLLSVQPGVAIDLPWLLFGMRLGVDAVNRPFLLLAGLLWTAAGCYSRGYLADDPERRRFHCFFLLTLAGNMGLILALDMASFYLFFTLLTFSAYGLVVHDGSVAARRAGRVYLVLAVAGEVLLLAAILLLAAGLGNPGWLQLDAVLAVHPQRDWIIGLVLSGFAIKAGLAPLHVWLPLAHSYAPTPASAVLSGIIIKAGVLGWLRFLPLGVAALPHWGQGVLAAGVLTTLYGVLCGLPQTRAKAVLAYSSVSQMGLTAILLGIALAAPQQWPLLAGALLLFSLHHGLAKGALFLGAGLTAQGLRGAGWLLVLPALILAGAPLSSGYLAKLLFKDTAPLAPLWAEWLPGLLALSSGATTLLLARFLYLVWPGEQGGPISAWVLLSWLGLLLTALALPWLWAGQHLPERLEQVLQLDSLLSSLLPLLPALTVAALAWLGGRRWGWRLPYLPEGDILAGFTALARRLPTGPYGGVWRRGARRRSGQHWTWLTHAEQVLQQLGIGGMLLLVLGAGMVVLLALS